MNKIIEQIKTDYRNVNKSYLLGAILGVVTVIICVIIIILITKS